MAEDGIPYDYAEKRQGGKAEIQNGGDDSRNVIQKTWGIPMGRGMPRGAIGVQNLNVARHWAEENVRNMRGVGAGVQRLTNNYLDQNKKDRKEIFGDIGEGKLGKHDRKRAGGKGGGGVSDVKNQARPIVGDGEMQGYMHAPSIDWEV